MKKNIFLLIFLIFSVTWNINGAIGQSYTLIVEKSGNGNGIITSSPAGINCGSDCTESLLPGKRITLKAKANQDSYFVGWSESSCGTAKNCPLVMNSDKIITATFKKKTPKISVSPDFLDFGFVEPGKKVTKILTISNTGTGDLHVTISIEGDYFSFSGNNSLTIKPNKQYYLKVTCKPPSEIVGTGLFESIAISESELDLEESSSVLPLDNQSKTIKGKITITSDDEDFPVLDIRVEGRLNIGGWLLKLDAHFIITSEDYHWTVSIKGDVSVSINEKYTIDCGFKDEKEGFPYCFSTAGTSELNGIAYNTGDELITHITFYAKSGLYIQIRGNYNPKKKILTFEPNIEEINEEGKLCYHYIDGKIICYSYFEPWQPPALPFDDIVELSSKNGWKDKAEINQMAGGVHVQGYWMWYRVFW